MSIFGKPYGLILDTNVLIDLFQPEKVSRETFNGFMDCVVLGKVKLIIPTQVKREWDKHKVERDQEYLEAAIRTIDKHKKLADHMPNGEEKARFIVQINTLKKIAEREYRYTYGARAKHLDRIINDSHKTIMPDKDNDVERQAVEMAIQKKAPFFGPDEIKGTGIKNEMADAVIFFTAYEFMKKQQNDLEKIYFVSLNKKDFCKRGNDSVLHDNLQPYADEVDMLYGNSLERLIEEIFPNRPKFNNYQMDDTEVYLTDSFFITCPECAGEIHVNADSVIDYSREHPHGLYSLVCPHCRHTVTTGVGPIDSIY